MNATENFLLRLCGLTLRLRTLAVAVRNQVAVVNVPLSRAKNHA